MRPGASLEFSQIAWFIRGDVPELKKGISSSGCRMALLQQSIFPASPSHPAGGSFP
jgi:hypothetical protein